MCNPGLFSTILTDVILKLETSVFSFVFLYFGRRFQTLPLMRWSISLLFMNLWHLFYCMWLNLCRNLAGFLWSILNHFGKQTFSGMRPRQSMRDARLHMLYSVYQKTCIECSGQGLSRPGSRCKIVAGGTVWNFMKKQCSGQREGRAVGLV
jgi:hypothetical protein